MTGASPVRTTPYELVFAAEGVEARLDDIRAEAETRHSSVDEPGQLIMLTEAGRLLRELSPDDADPASVLDAGRLIFHAYHFRAGDRTVYALEPAVLARLLEGSEATSGLTLPARAGYLQLPRNALWARVAEDAPWEGVDGLFWTVSAAAPEAGPLHELRALLVLGMRPDRPGFSVVPVDAGEPPDAGDWAGLQARSDGPDFGNLLPGGELAGLHSLVHEAEVLKLLSRFFRYLAAHPEAVQPEAPASGDPASARLRRFHVRTV